MKDTFEFFCIIKNDILNEESNNETKENKRIMFALGCNRFNHAIEITEEWYFKNSLTFTESIFSKVIGPCTCKNEKIGFFGVKKEE
jgi:hypothetical protein